MKFHTEMKPAEDEEMKGELALQTCKKGTITRRLTYGFSQRQTGCSTGKPRKQQKPAKSQERAAA